MNRKTRRIAISGMMAALSTAILLMGGVMLAINCGLFSKNKSAEKVLRITIPEDLDYDNIFDEVFEKYADNVESVSVKTANMGSLYKLKYNITLKDAAKEKEMIDALRCRNGNLEIALSNQEVVVNEL